MHSLREIRRITIGRTWVYIGTGGTHTDNSNLLVYRRKMESNFSDIERKEK